MKRALVCVSLSMLWGCGPSMAPASSSPLTGKAAEKPVEKAVDAKPSVTPDEAESNARIAAMLVRVSEARGLPIKRAVPGLVLNREEILKRIRADVEKETPREVLVGQGEALAALGLVPPDYDFIAGAFALLGGRIAGFYDPDTGQMVLADDLSDEEAEETLAHELAHALADQSYSIGPMVDYKAGEGDRLSAVHSFIEGDATSAMLDVTLGSAFKMPEEAVRMAFSISTTMSEVGIKTPKAINASLVAPYTDGFAIIQEMRRRGDWKAVDEVWRALPQTTEQLLHVDKLLAKEPALPVAVPSLGVYAKEGYVPIFDDVMGEQGLRIMLEDYAPRERAKIGAAGWGGDRLVVAEKKDGTKRRYVTVFRLRMDTADDAKDVGALLQRKHPNGCREREGVGPFAWRVKDRDVAIVAGPFERDGQAPRALGTCTEAQALLTDVWQGITP